MAIKHVLPVLFLFIITALSLTHQIYIPGTYPVTVDTAPSILSILNPNTLDVLFPGQGLMISAGDGTGPSRICYAVYDDAWLPEKQGKADIDTCYDFEKNLVGDCGPESDLRIAHNRLIPVNNAKAFIISMPQFESDSFLCSGSNGIILDDDYKEKACYISDNRTICVDYIDYRSTYSMEDLPFTEGYERKACIKTGEGNHFKCYFKDYSLVQKQESVPRDLVCRDVNGSSETVAVDTSPIEDGVHHIVYRKEDSSGNVKEAKAYTFEKTDRPYTSVSNPNYFNMMYPENERISADFYVFDTFFINAEYTKGLTGVWYKCDDGEWQRAELEGRLSRIGIDESACKESGWHTIYHFAESYGLKGAVDEYEFVRFERPRIENLSIGIEPINGTDMYRLTALGDFVSTRNLPGTSTVNWYENGSFKRRGTVFNASAGSNITLEYVPSDASGLEGTSVNATITTPETSVARDIEQAFILAIEDYNISLCEGIQDHNESMRCREAVEFGSRECADRTTRERFFCIAFLKNDTHYCDYIDLDWYRFNCLALISGSPDECMNLDGDERGLCITEFASSSGDPSLCASITDPDMRIFCKALASRDPGKCSSIDDPSLRERCSLQASYR